jgi:hypothetical protein
MDQSGRVQRRHAAAGGQHHAQALARRRRRGRDPAPQRAALDQLHHHEQLVAVAADLVHGQHVGMPDPRQRLRLAGQAGRARRRLARRRRRWQQLDRHRAIELRIPRRDHHAHAAAAQLAHDLEATDRGSGGPRGDGDRPSGESLPRTRARADAAARQLAQSATCSTARARATSSTLPPIQASSSSAPRQPALMACLTSGVPRGSSAFRSLAR